MSGISAYTIAGHLTLWVDQGAVQIKTHEPHGDPVELSEEDVKELLGVLSQFLTEIR